jgi:hypothetical protein
MMSMKSSRSVLPILSPQAQARRFAATKASDAVRKEAVLTRP